MDVLLYVNFFALLMGGKSQTKSIDHEFIAIFFLVNIFYELLNIINPRNTLIWSKYEYERSIFD